MQPEGTYCQSCGMLLSKPEEHGTESNGSQSEKYCTYYYQNGEFTVSEMTLGEMIEVSAKGWSDQDPNITYMQAKA